MTIYSDFYEGKEFYCLKQGKKKYLGIPRKRETRFRVTTGKFKQKIQRLQDKVDSAPTKKKKKKFKAKLKKA